MNPATLQQLSKRIFNFTNGVPATVLPVKVEMTSQLHAKPNISSPLYASFDLVHTSG
jgi:hypothetical protein